MLKELKAVTSVAKKSGLFLSGLAFGTAGLKLLASKDAKHLYSKAVATGYKIKDELDASVSSIKQHTDDVLQDAKAIYEADKKADQLIKVEGE